MSGPRLLRPGRGHGQVRELAQAGLLRPEDAPRAAVGSLATEAARMAAVPCPKGRYSPGPGEQGVHRVRGRHTTPSPSNQTVASLPSPDGTSKARAFEESSASARTYTNADGQSSCRDAKPGSFVASKDGSQRRRPAPAASSQAAAATAREDCLAGSYAKETGQSTCEPRSAGHHVKNKGATTETPCAEGFYAPSNGADECTPCALGTYAGTRRSNSSCKPARRGWYVDDVGASEPKKCERGTFTDAEGQSRCLEAQPGFYVPSDASRAEGVSGGRETSKPAPLLRATLVRLAPTPAPRLVEPQSRQARATAPRTTTKRKRFRGDEGYYSPGSGASECIKCSPAPTPTRAQSMCKKAKLDGASPVQKSKFHDAFLSISMSKRMAARVSHCSS